MTRSAFPPLLRSFRLAPLAGALFLLMAADGPCIVIEGSEGEGEGEGEACVDLERACPNLSCDFGFVEVDGCAICECAPPPDGCEDVGPPPECANARLTEDCRWTCEPDGCVSDRDCGDGFFCAFVGEDVPPSDGAEDRAAEPTFEGVCLPLEEPTFCIADSDCPRGEICVYDDGNGAAPPRDPDTDGEEDRFVAGTCQAVDEGCFSDEECREGQHCEFFSTPTGLIAAAGVCVDDIPVSECESDRDCNGGVCVVECLSDPSCPECDVCLFIGTCVDEQVSCFDDSECPRGEFCAIPPTLPPMCDDPNDPDCAQRIAPPAGICTPFQTGCNFDGDCGWGEQCIDGLCAVVDDRCISDADCGRGEFCDLGGSGWGEEPDCISPDGTPCDALIAPQTGICRPLDPTTECSSDRDCRAGQACIITDACVCDLECRPGPDGQCEPCACPEPTGVCVDVEPGEDCFLNGGICPDGQVCEIIATGCDVPFCDIGPDGEEVCFPCDPIPVGVCVDNNEPVICATDDDCASDQVCVFDDGFAPCDPATGACDAQRPARLGECKSADVDPCATVRCASGTCHVNAEGNAVCVDESQGCYGDQDCTNGGRCNAAEICLGSPDCPDCDVCYGFCEVPTEPEGCFGDQDCTNGGRCNAGDICLPPPGCENGMDCPAVCYGFCEEPAPADTCFADSDCAAGQFCAMDQNCACPEGANCLIACAGTCVDGR